MNNQILQDKNRIMGIIFGLFSFTFWAFYLFICKCRGGKRTRVPLYLRGTKEKRLGENNKNNWSKMTLKEFPLVGLIKEYWIELTLDYKDVFGGRSRSAAWAVSQLSSYCILYPCTCCLFSSLWSHFVCLLHVILLLFNKFVVFLDAPACGLFGALLAASCGCKKCWFSSLFYNSQMLLTGIQPTVTQLCRFKCNYIASVLLHYFVYLLYL